MTAATISLDRTGVGADFPKTSSTNLQGARLSQSGTEPRTLKLSFVSERAAFDALEAEWNALFERTATSKQLFQSFNWLWHWCNHYQDEAAVTKLAILTGRIDGRLVMVWPLVRETASGITELTWMGDPLSQYGDVLAECGEDANRFLAEAWEFIRSNAGADVVRLRKVRADARIAPLLASLNGLVTERLEAPFLDLASASNFAEYEKRYSGGTRRNRKRLFRRLDEQGAITMEEYEGGSKVRELVETAVALKRRWLRSRGLVSKAYADDRIIGFFSDAAASVERSTGCRVAVLSTAGRPVAIEVALKCKDRVALHIVVFDLDFEKSGAGVLLLEQSIRNAANTGTACYDLLAPGDSYKMDWADGTVGVEDWALPLSLKGRIYSRVYLGFVRERLKAAHAALPDSMRRAIADRVSRIAAAAA